MTCPVPAPQTIDDMLATIDRCATAAGGPGWQSLAMTGLFFVLVVVLLAATAWLLLRVIRW